MNFKVKECMEFVLPLVKECGKIMLAANDYSYRVKLEKLDAVTIYDNQIEDILMKKLKDKFPDHRFIGEEESEDKELLELNDQPTWFIDPIDGTSNFIKRLRMSAISIGLVVNREQTMGIVFNPFTDELYTAIKGEGAFLNGEKIETSGVTDIKTSVFSYELSLATIPKYYDLYMYRLKHLIKVVFGLRSLGSAVLSLCYVADGKLDAYQCDGLYPWDAAAGVLIVKEAGGYVCDSNGMEFDLMNPNFLVSSTKELSDQFMVLERKADEERIKETKN